METTTPTIEVAKPKITNNNVVYNVRCMLWENYERAINIMKLDCQKKSQPFTEWVKNLKKKKWNKTCVHVKLKGNPEMFAIAANFPM